MNNENDLLSTFLEPDGDVAAQFRLIKVPAETPETIFSRWGAPFYVKIDLEGVDHTIVRSILEQNRAPYISAEAHAPDVFLELIMAGYKRFKLVEGAYAHSEYCRISSPDFEWMFEAHAAGPFGEDVPGRWLSASEMALYLAANGYGWKDIHAKL